LRWSHPSWHRWPSSGARERGNSSHRAARRRHLPGLPARTRCSAGLGRAFQARWLDDRGAVFVRFGDVFEDCCLASLGRERFESTGCGREVRPGGSASGWATRSTSRSARSTARSAGRCSTGARHPASEAHYSDGRRRRHARTQSASQAAPRADDRRAAADDRGDWDGRDLRLSRRHLDPRRHPPRAGPAIGGAHVRNRVGGRRLSHHVSPADCAGATREPTRRSRRRTVRRRRRPPSTPSRSRAASASKAASAMPRSRSTHGCSGCRRRI
jgi:hypothetical protein